MHLRDNVLIHRDAIEPAELVRLAEYLQRAPMVDSLVSDFETEASGEEVEWVVNKAIRDTQEVELTSEVEALIARIDARNIQNVINPFYDVAVCDREPSHILHYGIGGHYIAHVDAETLYTDDRELRMWEKTLDRDLSVVYFLNDDFAGGELVFPDLDLSVQPEAGLLVCFPSDHNFIHGVNPVTAGHRYTLVTWMRVTGMPSVDEINHMALEEYERTRPKQLEQLPRVAKGGAKPPFLRVASN